MLNNSGKATLLLLTGLMMSSVAMADSGETVQGGSGNVTLSVPVTTTTCSVSIPETAITFNTITKNSAAPLGTVLDDKKFDINFKDCVLDSMSIKTVASDYIKDLPGSDDTGAFDSSTDPDQALYYRILLPKDPQIKSGGILFTSGDKYFNMKGGPLVIYPGAADYTLSSKIRLVSSGKNRSNLTQNVTGSFNYLVTYN
ncbi:TPA: type 1 fimbrial protein [Salmonella enterica subsp. enterica serovar Napoli]|nr:type 1 fimbrial protein [Salmonella enterica subsp. enterica serovar Napoli]